MLRARRRLTVASAMDAAMMGWWVANQVSPMAMASSAVLSAMLEMGSGLGVTAARTAVLEVCAASAMAAPKCGGKHLHLRRELELA